MKHMRFWAIVLLCLIAGYSVTQDLLPSWNGGLDRQTLLKYTESSQSTLTVNTPVVAVFPLTNWTNASMKLNKKAGRS